MLAWACNYLLLLYTITRTYRGESYGVRWWDRNRRDDNLRTYTFTYTFTTIETTDEPVTDTHKTSTIKKQRDMALYYRLVRKHF
jgi:hypothetical protein